jgi:hypothetical protein
MSVKQIRKESNKMNQAFTYLLTYQTICLAPSWIVFSVLSEKISYETAFILTGLLLCLIIRALSCKTLTYKCIPYWLKTGKNLCESPRYTHNQ